MTDILQRPNPVERDIDQAITALKRGARLLKYGRRGKPKFCPFRLSPDESTLIWYYGKDEKQLDLRKVSKIIPGQRTQVFKRYPRPEKEYQSFSLIYNDRSLDLICKDKDEAEVWFLGLQALIARSSNTKLINEASNGIASSSSSHGRRVTRSCSSLGDDKQIENRLGKAFADIFSHTATFKNPQLGEPAVITGSVDRYSNARTSGAETNRVSLSSVLSSSSKGSCIDNLDDGLGDVFIWGGGTDSFVPKALESTVVLDVQYVSCGDRHASLVTKQGEMFSWGEDSGGRLGHGVEADISHPKLIEALCDKKIETIACGECHTCAVTLSGSLYTWGDGSCGILGHGSEISHWIPRKVHLSPIEGLRVSSVSCGPWHTACLTFAGELFTFGDGTFGQLGHGNRSGNCSPKQVEALVGYRTVSVACGVWHTAAIVELDSKSSDSKQLVNKNLFTWGDGDKGRLGHGDNESRLVPECISSLIDINFSRLACGVHFTLALTDSGRVYTMGNLVVDGKIPTCINISDDPVEEIACGSYHVAVLTSRGKVYTWGKGGNGQLGHGDNEDRDKPTLIKFFKDKKVKSVACGSNFTAVISLHKWISGSDHSVCSDCYNPFNFRRKRHNCYNCGLVFCKACSTRKSLKASLAPCDNRAYRVCDDCFTKLQKVLDSGSAPRIHRAKSFGLPDKSSELSKLSLSDSFKSVKGSILSKSDSFNNRVTSLQNGNNQRRSTSSRSPTSPMRISFNCVSFSVPSSRVVSRSPSPVARTSSPVRSAEPLFSPFISFHTSEATSEKNCSGSLIQEVKILRAQVEELTCKTQHLEAELEIKSKQLVEMTARAADEAEKSKAAEQVIKSLTTQLKEMSERVPEKHLPLCLDMKEQMNVDIKRLPKGSGELCNDNSMPAEPQFDGTKVHIQISERTIEDEPGVYITLTSSSNGVNELRRICFREIWSYETQSNVSYSRNHFNEEEAEKWWDENETRVCEHYNIRIPQ